MIRYTPTSVVLTGMIIALPASAWGATHHAAANGSHSTAGRARPTVQKMSGERPPTPINGDISANRTLTLDHSPYVTDGFTVEGNAILTIEHGVVIKCGQNATINIGWGSPGFLIAKGVKTLSSGQTVPDPIHFLATLPNPTHGYWKGIRISNSQYRSVLDHVDISNAGSGGDPALTVAGGNSPTISNCNISWGDGPGVDASAGDAGFTQFDGNTISHFQGTAVMASPLAAGGISSNNELSSNGKNYIEVGGRLEKDAHWTNSKWPFVVSNSIDVHGDDNTITTLTLGPGVKLKFAEGAGLAFGWGNSTGQLVARGTADQPVVFTSAKDTPTPGAWQNVVFHTGGKSVMDHCIVEYAGSGEHAASIAVEGGQPSITNTTVRNGSGPGIEGNGDSPAQFLAFKGNTITAMQGSPLAVHLHFIPGIDSDNKLTGNADDVIRLEDTEVDTDMTWRRHDVPYFAPNNITVSSGQDGGEAVLTLEPGVHMVFGDDMHLTLGWSQKGSMNAMGTPDAPIVFSSHEKTPGKGDWEGINFNKSGGSTQLDHVEIDYAGKKDGDPPISAGDESRGRISNYTIAHSAAGGIRLGHSHMTQENGTFVDVDGDTVIKSD